MNAARRLTLGRDENGRRTSHPYGRRGGDWSGPCTLTYDLGASWPDPQPGDVVTTEADSSYLIRKVRRVRSSAHPRRFSLDCERVSRQTANDARLAGGRVYPLHWYRR